MFRTGKVENKNAYFSFLRKAREKFLPSVAACPSQEMLHQSRQVFWLQFLISSPSQLAPMVLAETPCYSGGTAPDFHRIPY